MATDITSVKITYSDLKRALGLPEWIELRACEPSQEGQTLTLILGAPEEVMQHDTYGRPIPLDYAVNMTNPNHGLSLRGFIGNPAALTPSGLGPVQPGSTFESPAAQRVRTLLHE